MYTPELQSQVETWRAKAKAGTLTKEELREALVMLREGRVGAARVSAKSRASKAPIDGTALLEGLFE
jgi:hypothetical protein